MWDKKRLALPSYYSERLELWSHSRSANIHTEAGAIQWCKSCAQWSNQWCKEILWKKKMKPSEIFSGEEEVVAPAFVFGKQILSWCMLYGLHQLVSLFYQILVGYCACVTLHDLSSIQGLGWLHEAYLQRGDWWSGSFPAAVWQWQFLGRSTGGWIWKTPVPGRTYLTSDNSWDWNNRVFKAML